MQFCPGLSAPSLHLFQVPDESHKDSHCWNASGLPPGDFPKGFPWSFLLLKALELAYSRLTPCPLASLPILLRTPPGSPSLFSCIALAKTGAQEVPAWLEGEVGYHTLKITNASRILSGHTWDCSASPGSCQVLKPNFFLRLIYLFGGERPRKKEMKS